MRRMSSKAILRRFEDEHIDANSTREETDLLCPAQPTAAQRTDELGPCAGSAQGYVRRVLTSNYPSGRFFLQVVFCSFRLPILISAIPALSSANFPTSIRYRASFSSTFSSTVAPSFGSAAGH